MTSKRFCFRSENSFYLFLYKGLFWLYKCGYMGAYRSAGSFTAWHCKVRATLLKQATRSEHAFSYYLSSKGIRFKQQQGFYTPVYRIADFYLPDHNLIVEIDGGYHQGQAAEDRKKDQAFLRERGIRTLRLTNEQVLADAVQPCFSSYFGNGHHW
jgi:very-short-patch-repair endonuclease